DPLPLALPGRLTGEHGDIRFLKETNDFRPRLAAQDSHPLRQAVADNHRLHLAPQRALTRKVADKIDSALLQDRAGREQVSMTLYLLEGGHAQYPTGTGGNAIPHRERIEIHPASYD